MNEENEKKEEQKTKSDEKRLEDLKARLGLTDKPRKKLIEEIKEEDFSFSFDRGQTASVKEEDLKVSVSEEEILKEKPILRFTKLTLIFIVCAVILFFVGTFFGKIFRDRKIENYKIEEAKKILEYFNTATVPIGKEKIKDEIKAHIEEIRSFYQRMKTVKPDPPSQELFRKQLLDFIEKCTRYRQMKVFYNVNQVFAGAIFNFKLAQDVITYIDGIKKIYQYTSAIAEEGEVLKAVTAGEEGEVIQFIYVEKEKIDNVDWLKGVYLARAGELKEKEGKRGEFEIAVLPIGEQKGFIADTTSILRLDIAPIQKDKSERHKNAILKRIYSDIEELKKAVDEVLFETLERELVEYSSKEKYFTLF